MFRFPKSVRVLTPSGKMEIGTSIIVAIIVCVVAAAIFVASYENVGTDIGRKQRSTACNTDGAIQSAASSYLISPIMKGLSGMMGALNNIISKALEKLADAFSSAMKVLTILVIILMVIIIVAAVLATVFSGGAAAPLLIAAIKFCLVLGTFIGLVGVAASIGHISATDLIDSATDSFASFAGSDFVNAENVGGCASGIVLREKPPDLSQTLAEEVDACLKMGRDAKTFRICRNMITIAKPEEDCEIYSASGRFLKQTDECSVTFFLSLFYNWGGTQKSNYKCESGVPACCNDPGIYFLKLYEVSNSELVGKNLAQQDGKNHLVWDSKLCKSETDTEGGVISENEECIIEMYYGYDQKVHVRAVT